MIYRYEKVIKNVLGIVFHNMHYDSETSFCTKIL
jgi:hypothetical protein